jgi:signal transduction histidine kinase
MMCGMVSVVAAAGSAPSSQRLDRLSTAGLLLAAAAAMVGAFLIERGNEPYTANFVHADDNAVGLAIFCIPVLGAVLLGLRPGHRTGRIMLGSGLVIAVGMLCHAVAVRWELINGSTGPGPDLVAWLATWLVTLGPLALPFALATWPDSRIESRWLRVLVPPAIGGLLLATAMQAVKPHHLDGVAGGREIPNPLAIAAVAPAGGALTAIGVGIVAVFGVAAAGDAVRRAFRARGARRAQLYPVAAAIVLLGLTVVAGAITGNPVFVLIVVAPIAGAGLVIAAWGAHRLERFEQARAVLVAEREAERQRLRRELHDGVGPLLAALRLELDAADPGTTGRARGLLADALGEVRRISRDLRPAALDELGLVGAVRQQAEILQRVGGLNMTVTADEIGAAPPAVEVAVLRIAAEAMTNVARHASATTCDVRLERHDDALIVTVADDGVGLGSSGDGAGLPSMRARAEELGGRCQIDSSSHGTTVEAVLPLDAP